MFAHEDKSATSQDRPRAQLLSRSLSDSVLQGVDVQARTSKQLRRDIDLDEATSVGVASSKQLRQDIDLDEATSVGVASSFVECGVCLGTEDEETSTMSLSCGHNFCRPCLHRHFLAELCKGRAAWCPTCRQQIKDEEVGQHCPGVVEEAQSHMRGSGVEPPPPTTWFQGRMEEFRLRRAAQRAHLKICPECRAHIEKNEGCNHMTCRCGAEFDWARAETVAPCHRLHAGRSGCKIWGSTCPGCSGLAKTKLVAWRTAVVVGAVPAGAVCAAAAVAAAPMVLAVKGGKKICRAVKRRRCRSEFLLYADSEYFLDDSASLRLEPPVDGSFTPSTSTSLSWEDFRDASNASIAPKRSQSMPLPQI